MTYVIVRIYAGASDRTPEQLSEAALSELAPRLASEDGFLRYVTMTLSDGRFGSFTAYSSHATAKRGQEIATDWVQTNATAVGNAKLDETLEGEVAFTAQGDVPMAGRLHGVIRLYQSDATLTDLKAAFDQEGPDIVKASFGGLSRYTVAKLSDGRVATFGSFDTQEHANNSSQAAKEVRGKTDSAIARLLPSDPQVIEASVLGVLSK